MVNDLKFIKPEYTDLRDWSEIVEKMGCLAKIDGADWNLEISAVADVAAQSILFDKIKDYPAGYRVLVNPVKAVPAMFYTAGINPNIKGTGKELNQLWLERLRTLQPIAPIEVKDGPIFENVIEEKDVDILKFPAPLWHEKDTSRYIGTADAVVMKDPDEGWINMGNFRLQVHDAKTMGLFMCWGKHGDYILKKYEERGESCPVVVLLGYDPAIYMGSYLHVPWGMSEYDFAGGLKGEPIEVVRGPLTGLPIPARAEIAFEGVIPCGERMPEGSFGEWTGYSEIKQEPFIKVQRIYHRNDPILLTQLVGQLPKPTDTRRIRADFQTGALIWDEIEKAGARGVEAIATYSRFLVVISIKQRYAGQARQAALLASQCHAGGFLGRYVIVVDDDIDPFNIEQVIWAMISRSDPVRALQILNYCWSDRMDTIHKGKPDNERGFNNRCIIDACRPYETKNVNFVPADIPQEWRDKVINKYQNVIKIAKHGGSIGGAE